jgi:hypothetical protein
MLIQFKTWNMSTLLSAIVVALFQVENALAQCLADPEVNGQVEDLVGSTVPQEGSCCQFDVCNIPCPEPVPGPSKGYGIAVALTIVVSFLIGVATIFVVKGEAENYFVAGHSLPLWIVAMTLGAQSVDSNALLGNVDLSYKYHFFDVSFIVNTPKALSKEIHSQLFLLFLSITRFRELSFQLVSAFRSF